MKASALALAFGAVLLASAPGVAADSVRPFPLQFHWSNGPHGYLVCTADEFKCGKGCCSDVRHSLFLLQSAFNADLVLGHRLPRQHWLLSERVSHMILLLSRLLYIDFLIKNPTACLYPLLVLSSFLALLFHYAVPQHCDDRTSMPTSPE
jgi:hypothetical protein